MLAPKYMGKQVVASSNCWGQHHQAGHAITGDKVGARWAVDSLLIACGGATEILPCI